MTRSHEQIHSPQGPDSDDSARSALPFDPDHPEYVAMIPITPQRVERQEMLSRYEAAVQITGNPDHEGEAAKQCRDRAFASASTASLGVFDGVGSLEGSAEMAEGAEQQLQRYLEYLPSHSSPDDAQKYIARSLVQTRDSLVGYSRSQNLEGGTTATVAKIVELADRKYLAYGLIGDSRLMVYRPSNGILRDVTLDETLISAKKPYNNRVLEQQALDSVKTNDDLHALPLHHKIAFEHRHNIGEHAIGTGSQLEPHTGYREVAEGDIVLGVSDAYTDNLTFEERQALLREAVEQSGGPDVASISEITAYMDATLQQLIKVGDIHNIRIKPDDATVAALRVG